MNTKQFAPLPFRIRDEEISVLLITTRKKRRWSVPKGWPIAGQRDAIWISARQAARMVHKPQLRRLIQQFTRSKRREVISANKAAHSSEAGNPTAASIKA
jgi:hypothetical protein